MELSDIRKQIDEVDASLVSLFLKRMALSEDVARYKKEHNLPIYVPAREREKLQQLSNQAGSDMESYIRVLYSLIFEISRSHQSKKTDVPSALYDTIAHSIEHTPKLFPQTAMVACQGVEGAYSQIACEKIFKSPMILYFKNFEGVFQAVEQGLCQYGILPIENSTAGSVTKVYDLMKQHRFSIVRTFRQKIEHYLLAKSGATLDSIRCIYSHEQAIAQCHDFLKDLKDVKIIPVENTAVAAQMVSKAQDPAVAAISSRSCQELYGLTALRSCIQDKNNNRTRFICISKNLEIYPGSDKTSMVMTLPHKPGALYKVLARLYVLGINVIKLESRPIPDKDFEFMFYFDLETSIYSEEFIQLMCELEELCESFTYFGSYTEVI